MAKKEESVGEANVMEGQQCPFCHEKKLVLRETERDIPFFGEVYLFSMDCDGCGYHKADVESAEDHGAVKYALEVDSEDDMKIRIVKASTATIKIPHVGSIEPGEASNGYVTNVEGVLSRLKKQVEILRDEAEDKSDRKKAKNIVKKLTRVMWGQEKLKMTLEDPKGNSAIVSEKAVKGKL
ncbi:ZPR1 zinc finger domain-containing protein [Candidatus Woesearchaeota archaeon]|nr:ZPR1 zinc finger domain-containing protein [Candidatus Woesearchaeota archaeon]